MSRKQFKHSRDVKKVADSSITANVDSDEDESEKPNLQREKEML